MTFYEAIARDAFPNGAILGCSKCGSIVEVNSAQCAEFLASGWPSHCGQTMTLKGRKAEKHGSEDSPRSTAPEARA